VLVGPPVVDPPALPEVAFPPVPEVATEVELSPPEPEPELEPVDEALSPEQPVRTHAVRAREAPRPSAERWSDLLEVRMSARLRRNEREAMSDEWFTPGEPTGARLHGAYAAVGPSDGFRSA
jgi:hypothetical protein